MYYTNSEHLDSTIKFIMSSIQPPTSSSSYLIPTPQINGISPDFPLRDPTPYIKMSNTNNYHYNNTTTSTPTISHSSGSDYNSKPPLFINSKNRSTSPSDNSYNNNRYNRSRSPISTQRRRGRRNSKGREEEETSDISNFHLLPEVVSYYRDLVKSGRLPNNTLDGRCFAALKDLGSSKAIDALRALSECNINKIRNPVPYFLQIVKRCKNGYVMLDGSRKRI